MGGGKHATERGLWHFEDFEVDEKQAVEERQGLGRKVAEVAGIHWDDPMQITPIESPQLQDERFWQVDLMKEFYVVDKPE